MVEMTVSISDDLAQRLRPMSPWVGVVLEISLLGLKTPATQIAADLVTFLASGPTPADVMAYQASTAMQERARRLRALNTAGLLSESEQAELDELAQIEHLVVLLKAQAYEQSHKSPR